MNTLSLSGFLKLTEANFRLFDLGTQLRKLPKQSLTEIDSGKPYPWPHLGFAWLVIFLWNPEQKQQNSFWFLKLPLDEQGIVSAAVHSDLVNRLYRSLRENQPEERQRLMNDHPFQFQPDTEKQAALHARVTSELKLPASPFWESADQFYRQGVELDWQQLGVQGIADMLCRTDEAAFKSINQRLKTLPEEPARYLMRQLEHIAAPTTTVATLLSLAQAPSATDGLQHDSLRGASQSNARRLFDDFLLQRICSSQLSLETLLLVLTRYHYLLDDLEVATTLLDQLADQADSDGFHRVITNLTMQPGMQGIVRRVLSSPSLTEPLANALSLMIRQQRYTYEKH
ncbi:MAG: DUF3549 family protein [Reinekea sp.]|jgi:hypothetical protein